MRELVALHADVAQVDQAGSTALMLASANGHETVVRALVAQATPDGWTALMLACCNGHTEAARLLIHPGIFRRNWFGADVNQANDIGGVTALMLACSKGRKRRRRGVFSTSARMSTRRTTTAGRH